MTLNLWRLQWGVCSLTALMNDEMCALNAKVFTCWDDGYLWDKNANFPSSNSFWRSLHWNLVSCEVKKGVKNLAKSLSNLALDIIAENQTIRQVSL